MQSFYFMGENFKAPNLDNNKKTLSHAEVKLG